MQSRYSVALVVTSFMVMLGAGRSWGGPPNPTPSDANANTAGGTGALFSNTGSGNIAIGNQGVAGETNTIRVGTSQTRTFMAGIHGKVISGGSTVLINASGQIGTVVSSARYKQDIVDMGTQSAKLQSYGR
jgi:hypothetical protein